MNNRGRKIPNSVNEPELDFATGFSEDGSIIACRKYGGQESSDENLDI